MEKGWDIRSGFTLIELMIVVAIIGILSAIAIPDFLRFSAKAKQAEAKMNLGEIFVAQTAYFTEAGIYAGKTNASGKDAFSQIGWEPKTREVMRYTYILDEAVFSAPSPPGSLPASIPSTSTGFTAIAAGNIDNDPDLDVWTINNNRALRNTTSDVFD